MTTPSARRAGFRLVRGLAALAGAILAAGPGLAGPALAATPPEIRTSEANAMPACVTPDRLMAFLKSRNRNLDPRFKNIASHYKTYGEAWRVRWDYAFYQMAIETNFLTYRAPNGRRGDVDPKQNNFAGIGTTGGGVPGNSFPDVKTGVHAQIQHLVVYSGERLAAPIAPRTALKQDEILLASLKLDRRVSFADLAGRWAVDRNYDKSIEWVASQYRKRFCAGRQAAPKAPAKAAPASSAKPKVTPAAPKTKQAGNPAVRTVWVRSQTQPPQQAQSPQAALAPVAKAPTAPPHRTFATAAVAPVAAKEAATFDPAKLPPSGLGATSLACSIDQASYGGSKSVLIKSAGDPGTRYTVLGVHAGFERSMTDAFIKSRTPDGEAIGEFETRDLAVQKAQSLCAAPG